jgi:D-glycero-alpha-D-manno-heptose-7-phosphate kinase
MIISRTPFRISFFGGGTDYPDWYRKHGGSVLVTTINKYCYLSCRYFPPFFDFRYRISYIKSENCQSIDEITHPAVREVLRFLKWDRGLEVHHIGDLPARGGLGSSSAFTVGLLHALYGLRGQAVSKHQLTMESIHIEQEMLRETVGSQDQAAAAHGGLNHILFSPSGEVEVRPLTLSLDRLRELESHLMLFYTGIRRTASDVAQSYVRDIDRKEDQMAALSELVREGLATLQSDREITEFGQLLHKAWQVKRAFSPKVSNAQIDEIYDSARSAGAVGGKILGAGGGGFMVLFVRPELQAQVRTALRRFIHVPFKIDHSGSQLIYYDPQEDLSAWELERQNLPIEKSRELERG